MTSPYRLLGRRFILWLRRSISFLWLVVVAGYLTVVAGQAVYQNYQQQQGTQSLQRQLEAVKLQKVQLQELLQYYQSDSYKEKQLRQDLLMKKPNEQVFALPESGLTTSEEDAFSQLPPVPTAKPASTDPVWKQWMTYVWTGNR